VYMGFHVVEDRARKLYQLHMVSSIAVSEEDLEEAKRKRTINGISLERLEFITVFNHNRFKKLVDKVRYLEALGYTAVGPGTKYPAINLPSNIEVESEKWR